MALRGNRLGFRQVDMQGSHAGSLSSQQHLPERTKYLDACDL
jgi:hypothetical protein